MPIQSMEWMLVLLQTIIEHQEKKLFYTPTSLVQSNNILCNINNFTCVRANLLRKCDVRGRDRRKLLIWKATTGRGYRRSVRVCSVKLASRFCELKNRTWRRQEKEHRWTWYSTEQFYRIAQVITRTATSAPHTRPMQWLSKPPPIQKFGAKNHMLQLNI